MSKTGLIYDEGYPYPSEEELQNIFAASCIEDVATHTGQSTSEIYERMSRVNLISEYIYPCYNVLHAESRENVTKDIIATLEEWEKRKIE